MASAMKTKLYHPDAFSNRRFLISLSLFVAGTILAACINRIFEYSQPLAEKQICRRRSAIADRSAWISSQWSKFWTQTNGPQGGDGIALARNSIGHVFVGTQ